MRKIWLVLGLLSLTVAAQQLLAPPLLVRNGPPWSPAEPRLFTSAQDIEAHLARADASVKAGKVYNGGPLLMQGPHRIQMEWRNAPQLNTNLHETDAELFVVIEGSGTMTLGGTLINPRRTLGNAWEGPTQIATSARGGVAYRISRGDMIMIPEHTAHTVSEVNGKLVVWALHLPGPAARSPAEPARATATIAPAP
jgi:mannose-6-phosphate isomerase-like protein (cupin superfamily)